MEGVYLIHTRELFTLNLEIYKIGRSYNIDTRIKNYPQGSKTIVLFTCKDSVLCEKNLIEIFKSINPKTKKLIGIIWVLFHLFMLFTSENIFDYWISWEDFWIFNNWIDYTYSNYGYGGRYDISEFIIYVIIPLLIIYGRKYIKGEKILISDLSSSIKQTNTDDRINDLKKFKELFDLGVISEEEFTEIKKKLL